MAGPLADFVVSLNTDGHIVSQGSVKEALAKDSTLAEEVKHEEERPKKKSKKAKAKDAKSKQEEDQEFLMKYVPSPLFRAPTSFLFFT